jgi:hypothetical protein
MATKPNNQADALRLLQESIATDALNEGMTIAEVDRELREAGGDPVAIAQRGEKLVQQLLEARRLAWQEAARKRLDAARSRMGTRKARSPMSRDELLKQIDNLRTDPTLGAPATAAFRKRKPEESTVEELVELLDELEALRAIGTDDGSKDK